MTNKESMSFRLEKLVNLNFGLRLNFGRQIKLWSQSLRLIQKVNCVDPLSSGSGHGHRCGR